VYTQITVLVVREPGREGELFVVIHPEPARPRLAYSRPNGIKLVSCGCKITFVARRAQEVLVGDRLADRIGIGVLAKVFTGGAGAAAAWACFQYTRASAADSGVH
jgi:hypothetical protein